VRRPILLLVCLALAGCVPAPARVDNPRIEALDKSYTVDLPAGWIRQHTQEKNIVASRDGFPLETLAVIRRPLKQAFQRTKKDAAETMLPSELAELEIAEIKARDELTTALSVLENEPALVSGKEGFRVKVAYRNPSGLEIHEEVHGVVDKSGLYLLAYRAPRLHYFATYYPDFQTTVESFRITP
jgi:hypothetical protein